MIDKIHIVCKINTIRSQLTLAVKSSFWIFLNECSCPGIIPYIIPSALEFSILRFKSVSLLISSALMNSNEKFKKSMRIDVFPVYIKKIENYVKSGQLTQEQGLNLMKFVTDKAYEKYSELADVYRAAYKYQSEADDSLSRRLGNMSSYIEEHIECLNKQTYTKKEVLRIAEEMKQFCF